MTLLLDCDRWCHVWSFISTPHHHVHQAQSSLESSNANGQIQKTVASPIHPEATLPLTTCEQAPGISDYVEAKQT